MAQAQLDERPTVTNIFYVNLDGELTVKAWKKKREGTFVTLIKPSSRQNMTVPLSVFQTLLESQDVLLLAANCIRGLVGFSPANLLEDTITTTTTASDDSPYQA